MREPSGFRKFLSRLAGFFQRRGRQNQGPYYNVLKEMKRYPALSDIMNCGCGSKEDLKVTCELYLCLVELGTDSVTWHSIPEQKCVYLIGHWPRKDNNEFVYFPLPRKPISPFWFWTTMQVIRDQQPRVAASKEIVVVAELEYGNPIFCGAMKYFGDYTKLPPEETVSPMKFMLHQRGIIRSCWL